LVAADVMAMHTSIIAPIPQTRGFLKPKRAIEIMAREYTLTPPTAAFKLVNDLCVSLDMDADSVGEVFEECSMVGFEMQCYADRLARNDGIYSRGLFDDEMDYEAWNKIDTEETNKLVAKYATMNATRVLVIRIDQVFIFLYFY
jgi:hypothetical protein